MAPPVTSSGSSSPASVSSSTSYVNAPFWKFRKAQLAMAVGSVALVMAAVAAFFFVPGSPLALVGAFLISKLAVSAVIGTALCTSSMILLPSLITYFAFDKYLDGTLARVERRYDDRIKAFQASGQLT